ncbi:MAG TPA: TonB-dependent siderophore receptor, partial [Erythrobacter sp.]|nr:TonB-dependent siderophore receptor [Erythrobacter sp.]
MKAILATTTATLALALAAPAFAQNAQADTDNETAQADASAIVVTGTLSEFGAIKSDTPIVEVARSISIETQQDFVIKGAQSLDDALTYTAGV